MARKVGRPSQDIDTREALIHSARELFSIMPYEKVSTRLIAEKAGVNIALIRYYFGSKVGLFETMIRETIAPMKQTIAEMEKEGEQQNFLNIMKTYYSTMGKNPDFPRLIGRTMMMDEDNPQRQMLVDIMTSISMPARSTLDSKLSQAGMLQPGLDPKLSRLSFISLMVFPFLAPPEIMKMHNIELTEEFLEQLLEHNLAFIQRGLLAPMDAGEEHDPKA
ncbi:TetR/AcrR family transcriptional regulator [Vibrio sp. SCSIO 43136]|uniref:TetR/AcrR family transcriptional regulator n=1 Tax=Vibrio sp. SCSIO 43136 TaxID=2819101 RepID=UPI002075E32A|nr:TetR/AcrR family transcriptional regulator [Vibrio sp. SCSIO 43136]USD64943.1 TetR/AcrR family transcriptional regulator [Vibrio sp. SCSIO 43136]